MVRKQEQNDQENTLIQNKVEILEELTNTLKKDEEVLKQNLIALNGQLQYNQGVQRTIQQLIGKLLNAPRTP